MAKLKYAEYMASKKISQKLDSTLLLAGILLALGGFLAGYFSADALDSGSSEPMSETHIHSDDFSEQSESHDHSHIHSSYEVPGNAPKPAITNLSITKDSKSGWNLSLETDNFTFTPENVGSDHVEGEGHAHVYVDGKKITRIYSSDFYLGELSEGTHTVRVTLNTNDHMDYSINGNVVEASQEVTDMHHSN